MPVVRQERVPVRQNESANARKPRGAVMLRRLLQRSLSWLNAVTSRLGHAFVEGWGRVEKGYRRPNARVALRLGFVFYPLLTVLALGWLGWDWSHARNLAAVENAVFDQMIAWRPVEPVPSGQVVIVEIDQCSINHFRALGEGGWPWSRARHADLLDALDRAGVRAVGYDVLFVDPSMQDPQSDAILDAMAAGADGRFVFASTRLHADYDSDATLRASQAPAAFPLAAKPQRDPTVALMLPYGEAMRRNSALINISRGEDGVLRNVPLREKVGDWAIPSLALRLVAGPHPDRMARYPASVRINWRTKTRLPTLSAANLLEGKRICGDPAAARVPLKGRTVLVGYTAAGLNDAKPTPVDLSMPGVAVHAEAVESLLADSAIWLPPAWFKYLLAALLVLLTGYAYFRGEPAWELDDIFLASNLVLLLIAFIGISFFSVFLDIFAAMGFVALFFGLCRFYATTQRGYAIGNDDYRPAFDPRKHPWLALARLRFVPDSGMSTDALDRRQREFRRRLRRFMYGGTAAVALDCVVEYDTWLWESMADVTVFMWGGVDRDQVIATAHAELDALQAYLLRQDEVLPDDGSVRVAWVVSHVGDDNEAAHNARTRICQALGEVLGAARERPLREHNAWREKS